MSIQRFLTSKGDWHLAKSHLFINDRLLDHNDIVLKDLLYGVIMVHYTVRLVYFYGIRLILNLLNLFVEFFFFRLALLKFIFNFMEIRSFYLILIDLHYIGSLDTVTIE